MPIQKSEDSPKSLNPLSAVCVGTVNDISRQVVVMATSGMHSSDVIDRRRLDMTGRMPDREACDAANDCEAGRGERTEAVVSASAKPPFPTRSGRLLKRTDARQRDRHPFAEPLRRSSLHWKERGPQDARVLCLEA